MKKLLCLCMLILLIGCETNESEIDKEHVAVVVERVVDGDTFVTEDGDKVRMILIDTPESVHPDQSKNTPFGKIASDYTRNLLEGKVVYLERDVSDTDRYGRLLRYVYLEDGTFVNEHLVKEGYAQIATFPPDVTYEAEILAAERYAREHEKGLWGLLPESEGYVGSINSDKYHLKYCKHVASIAEHNLIEFETVDEAEAAGYVPCKTCLAPEE